MNEQKPVSLNEEDVKLIKSVCDEKLLQAVRAVFFGLATQEDRELVRGAFKGNKLKDIFSQRFLPTITRETPIGQIQDTWLGAESMVFDKAPTTIQQAISYKNAAIRMTRQALTLLDNPDGPAPDIGYDPTTIIDELGIGLLSRNMFVRHIESQLSYLKLIAMQVEETPAQKIVRTSKSSSK